MNCFAQHALADNKQARDLANNVPEHAMPKHLKSTRPSNSDLAGNPLIGGSKGTTMAGITPDDLQDLKGVNTIEGDIENDVNEHGGIDKAESRSGKIKSR
jgi:hypothetical protein